MTKAVIIAWGFASGAPCPHEGQYLRKFNFEAHGGQGQGVFTPDLARAKRFADKGAAMEFWKTQSRVNPLRPDGQPNRPLTALTVEIREIDA